MTQKACQQYYNNFDEFANLNSRILFCAMAASLLHDIGRCFGGENRDIFGSLSADIAEQILTSDEVGDFSEEEINWIKKAIKDGGLSKEFIDTHSNESGYFFE